MSKRNATAFEIGGVRDAQWQSAGAYWFDPDRLGLHFACPCGCGAIGRISFRPNMWTLTESAIGPTARPSIGFGGNHDSPKGSDGYHWHGYLTNGVFEEC